MRVLIVLALIGTAFGSTLIAEAPLAYSSLVYDSPKSSYEYGSSVQTPTYNNYAFVRSGDYERRFINVPATQQYAIAEQQPAVIAARFYQEPTAVFAKAPSVAEVAKAAIPNALPTNFALNSQFTEIRRSFPFSAPAVALPATKLLPIAQSTPILATRYAAPIATPFAAPIAASFAAPIATPIAAPILRTAEPIAVAATAPAAIVDTVVEQKAIGEGLLERKSQYHTQNELGEATYGHREPFQAHDAVQDAAGNKAGSFSYVSPDGRLLQTNYVADQDGYRVASNALPEAPKSRKRRSIAIAAPAVVAPSSLIRSYPLISNARYYNPLPLSYSYSPLSYSYPSLYRTPYLAPSYGGLFLRK